MVTLGAEARTRETANAYCGFGRDSVVRAARDGSAASRARYKRPERCCFGPSGCRAARGTFAAITPCLEEPSGITLLP